MSVFVIEAAGIKAEAERKNVKYIRLKVVPPDGRVKVSIPRRASLETVRSFMEEKKEWILAQQERIRTTAQRAGINGSGTDSVMLWGRKIKLIVREGAQHNSVHISGDELVVSVRTAPTQEQLTAMLDEFYRSQMQERLPDVAAKWERHTGASADEWRVRIMKTRWGSCNVRCRRIWLNNRLAMLPPECLDSVVVHELCHLYESGHGERFKALMDKYYPDWRTVRKYMKTMSAILS